MPSYLWTGSRLLKTRDIINVNLFQGDEIEVAASMKGKSNRKQFIDFRPFEKSRGI
jgi:hypothetical protein